MINPFSQQYRDHAHYDLILEAEQQGIEIGAELEYLSILQLLDSQDDPRAEWAKTLINDSTKIVIDVDEESNG
jgi:hypothetical protein